MCGIIAILLANQHEHCNQGLYDGLTVLQHRGQGALCLMERTPSPAYGSNHPNRSGGLCLQMRLAS